MKEKQIEEMAELMCDEYDNGICRTDRYECNHNCYYHNKAAQRLYEAGYRKQSEGEWKKGNMPTYGGYKCSVCGGNTIHYKANFCPNCGAKMKGGE